MTMPRTAFSHQVHGFAFANSWEFNEEERRQLREMFARYLTCGAILGAAAFGPAGAILIPLGIRALRKELESHLSPGYGLCGGMCFTALDFYNRADLTIPRRRHRDDRPAPRTPLRSYIWKRQLESIASDGARFMAWLIALNHIPQGWPCKGGPTWLLSRSKEEWKKLKASVDAGEPVPIGLVRDTKNIYDNHQVLAIGYDQVDETQGTIYLYDPNCPDGESTIHLKFGEQLLSGTETCGAPDTLRGFFCEAYRRSDPTEAIERRARC
jgi:hypothetical protein